MDQGTRKTLMNMASYFQDVLHDEEKLGRDLLFSKKHTDIEYYNIASIMMQKENAQYVMSLENWKKRNNKIVPQKLQRPLAVFIPDIQDNVITFKSYRVFDIEQVVMNEQDKIDLLAKNRSHLYRVMQEVTVQKIINLCGDKKNWRNEMITEYLNSLPFYNKAEQKIRELYLTCLHFTFQEELDEKDIKIRITKIEKNECRRIYKNVHEAIAGFHFFFIDFIKIYAVYEKERKERMMMEMDKTMSLKDLVNRAKKIKRGEKIIYPEVNDIEIFDSYEKDNPQKLTAAEESMADMVVDC